MDENAFSTADLSLLFLFRSHVEICKSLAPLVEWRMRTAFPREWKENIASCFSRTTREKIRDRLEDGKKIQDIFVLCKVIKRFIRVVFRVDEKQDELNGNVAKEDFQWTEYLHRAVEAMETIRNRIFHGEGVFPDEVMVSISHSSQTMSLLTRTTQDERVKSTIDALHLLKREFSEVLSGRRKELYVSAEEGTDVFLYRCLVQLEKDLRRLVQTTFPTELEHTKKVSRNGDLNQLLDFLKVRVSRRELRERRTPGIHSHDLHLACRIVKDVRNMQAHERANCTTFSLLRKMLERAWVLWKAFDFDSQSLKQVIGHVEISDKASLPDHRICSTSNTARSFPFRMTLPTQEHLLQNLTAHRATRSRGKVFVGRKTELNNCTAFLGHKLPQTQKGKSASKSRGKLLVIEGASGVGKTSLAGELLDMMREQYPRQMWLCSSTPEILMTELSTHLQSCGSKNESRSDEVTDLSEAACVINLLAEEFFVFDDVTVETLEIVEQLFTHTSHDHSVVITTCLEQLNRFGKFSKTFSDVYRVCLSNLKTETSLELLQLRGIPLQESEDALRHILEMELENLPLAVNIFASLVEERLWSEMNGKPLRLKKNGARRSSLADEASVMEALLADFETNLKEEIVKFSLRSTESPHIRGIAGLVNIAVKRLVQEPSALVLVILVVMAGPMGLPLRHMASCWSATRLYSELDIDGEDIDSMRLLSAVECLLGPDGSVRDSAMEVAISTGLVMRQQNIPILQMHQLLMCYFERHVLNDMRALGDWVKTTSSTVKYVISVLLAEHYLMAMVPLFGQLGVEKQTDTWLCVAANASLLTHLYRSLCSCEGRVWPVHLIWILPVYIELYGHLSYFPAQTEPEKLFVFLNALGIAQQMYGTRFINHFVWVTFRWFRAVGMRPVVHSLAKTFQTTPVNGPWPNSTPPFNLFYFIGAPNLAWQTFASKGIKSSVEELCGLVSAVLLCGSSILRRSRLEQISCQKLSISFFDPARCLSETHKKGSATEKLVLASDVELLLKLQLYSQLIRMLLSKDELGITKTDASVESGAREVSSYLDILLVGSIVFHSVGLEQKSQHWSEELLRRIKNCTRDFENHKRYRSMAYAILGRNFLVQGSVSEALDMFTMSISSIGSELECAWHLADKGIKTFCSLFTAYHEIIAVHAFLSVFLMRSEEELTKIDLYDDPLLRTGGNSTSESSMPCRPFLSGRVQDLERQKVSLYLMMLGRLYKDGFHFLREENLEQSKFLLSQWVQHWHGLIKLYPQFRDKEVPEAALLSILAMHVLRSLGCICEKEMSLSEAVMFYTRSLNQLDGIFMDIHLTRADLHSDLVRVLLKLGKLEDAEKHAQHIARSKLAIFGLDKP